MVRRVIQAVLAYALSTTLLSTCRRDPEPAPAPADAGAPAVTTAIPEAGVGMQSAPPAADATTDASSASAARSACPPDMLLVEGEFCPEALQLCQTHHPEYSANPSTSERCMQFHKPSRCLSKARKLLRFCIDRYEWPNQKGEKPLVLVQWTEAKQHCERVGKRLCDEQEWLFACEGEDMLPHVYGYTRDPSKCQIDRPYRRREKALKRYDACLKDPECKRLFDKIDQREPAGTFDQCISPFGAYDMNGSVNEWVNVPERKYPLRSGLKGGWWGPVRNRCRPTVLFHKEDDWGYEAGFRCCKGAAP